MKKILFIMVIMVIIGCTLPSIYAVTDPGYNPGLVNGTLQTKAKDIWATIAVIVQILAVAAVVFAGVRYMFASSSQKADIKQGMIYLTIGAVLVFGAVQIIKLVAGGAMQIM